MRSAAAPRAGAGGRGCRHAQTLTTTSPITIVPMNSSPTAMASISPSLMFAFAVFLSSMGKLVSRWSIDISREPGRRGRLNVRKGWGGYGCEPSSRGVLGRGNIPDIDAPCVLASLGSRSVVICVIADHSRPAQGDAKRLGHHGDIDRPS